MKNSREVVGLPVIELNEGKALGRIHSLVVNPEARRVEALEVGERSLLKTRTQLLPYAKIRSIGRDAVTLTEHDAVQEPEQNPELARLLDRKLIGSRLVTIDGTLVGTVSDFSFDENGGALAELYVTVEKARHQLKLPVNAVENFGRDFIIVKENYRAEEVPLPGDGTAKNLTKTLEVRAIDFVLDREAGQDVLDDNGAPVIRRGEKVTAEVIDLAREKNRLVQVLIAAGVGELLEGYDYTRDKLDAGSRRLLDTWQMLRHRSQDWLSRKLEEDRPGPTGELRELWFQLQGRLSQGGRDLETVTVEKIKTYVDGKKLAHPVYDKHGILLAEKGTAVNAELIANAENEGRLPQLFLSSAAGDVQIALDPIKQQLKDVLRDWDRDRH